MKLVNVGCGQHISTEWINLDLVSGVRGVTRHDLRQGLPFSANQCDVVYHSHLLEHLTPTEARAFLLDCYRVLRPGGILRVVVPDLEGIARAYLRSLEASEQTGNTEDLDWMRIELLDQMVREYSGGTMRSFVDQSNFCNRPFVQSRIGDELFPPDKAFRQRNRKTFVQRLRRFPAKLTKLRRAVILGAVAVLGGRSDYRALKEGRFRQSGEIHRWMYDRISLCCLLGEIGFMEAGPCRPDESQIPNFEDYQLDSVGSRIRKPDSLFVEAIKPEKLIAQAA